MLTPAGDVLDVVDGSGKSGNKLGPFWLVGAGWLYRSPEVAKPELLCVAAGAGRFQRSVSAEELFDVTRGTSGPTRGSELFVLDEELPQSAGFEVPWAAVDDGLDLASDPGPVRTLW